MWETIYGRRELVNALQKAISSRLTAHAYLFYGPEGIGKKTFARVLAAALNCTTAGTKTCGDCSSCRKALQKTHPDIIWLAPDGKTIKLEQIRNLKRQAYLQPQEGRFQVFILEKADTMTEEAANSLLKILEEPPETSIFILLARHPAALPSTVASRCQLYAVSRLDKESMEKLLAERGLEEQASLAEILAWSEGIPGRAMLLADKKARQALYDKAVDYLSRLAETDTVSLLSAELAEERELPDLVDASALVLRDLLVRQSVSEPEGLLMSTSLQLPDDLAAKWPPRACRTALRIALSLLKDMQKPVNVRILVERALVEIKGVLTYADSGRSTV
ncbi:MAG: DNA polymerase III subunit delta' [Bacillota bacterium]|nr:DNA polymerase III subunit delta' [Bacillota bacterium]